MAGFIRFNKKGEEVLSFGKYRDVTLAQIWNDNPGYFSWIDQADFPLYTKNVMKVKNKIGVIDTQDALIGNPVYDLVSLIDDARIKTSEKLKNKLNSTISIAGSQW